MASTVASESFTYYADSALPGDLNGQNGGTGWSGAWTAATSHEIVIAPTTPLTYTFAGTVSYQVTGGNRALEVLDDNDNLAYRSLTTGQSGDLWVRFLVRWDAAHKASEEPQLTLWLDDASSGNHDVTPQVGLKSGSQGDFVVGLKLDSSADYAGQISVSTTGAHSIVAHLYKSSGSTKYNNFAMWVDASAAQVGNTLAPATVYAIDSRAANDSNVTLATASTIGLKSKTFDTGDKVIIDELSFGSTLADVLGPTVAPRLGTVSSTGAGNTLVGSTKTGGVTITNVGNGSLLSPAKTLDGSSGAASGPFSGLSTDPLHIADATPNPGSQTLSYTFAPTVRGAASQSVNVAFTNGSPDGLNNPYSTSATLSGTGVAPVRSPVNDVNFGNVRVGASASANATITNNGDGNLSGLGDASNLKGQFGAASAAPFSGAGGAFNLPDSASAAVEYGFAPIARGPLSQNVAVQLTNGSLDGMNQSETLAMALKGTGVGPVFGSSVPVGSLIDFGEVSHGSYWDIALTLWNSTLDPDLGNLTDLSLPSYTLTLLGGPPLDFSVLDFSPTVLNKGVSVDYHLRFSPTDGPVSARLTFLTDVGAPFGGPGASYYFDLLGKGIPLPAGGDPSAVPEPVTLAGLGLGILGLVRYIRRRR
jgi:hypothetical protein